MAGPVALTRAVADETDDNFVMRRDALYNGRRCNHIPERVATRGFMLQILKSFLNEVGIGDKPASRFDENDYRLAAAALLIHVMTIDGNETVAEQRKLHDLLKRQFELDDDAVDELIEAASTADREAVDLYAFTSIINRSLDEEGRKRLVRMMWEMVYADGRMNEFEDNVLWRASDLLGISQRDRVEMRREVAALATPHDDA
jgi:uncharacterized tellurite resistance protein B-like protein